MKFLPLWLRRMFPAHQRKLSKDRARRRRVVAANYGCKFFPANGIFRRRKGRPFKGCKK